MRVQRDVMFYDPYTALPPRVYNDSQQPVYISPQATASYWSDVGSPIQSGIPGAHTNYASGPSVVVRYMNGNLFELRQIEGADNGTQEIRKATTLLLADSGLPRLRKGDLIYMVHSNKVASVSIKATPGTRVHILKKKTDGIALKDIEIVNGQNEIDAHPSPHDRFILVVMRACGYFACNIGHQQHQAHYHRRAAFHQGIFSESTRTLSNMPGSTVMPNSPHVQVAW